MTATDYTRLIDAPMRAFIERSEAFYPPGTADLTIREQRRIYDRMCAGFYRPRPEGITVHDAPAGGVPCRHYRPDAEGGDAHVVYCHGGGFVVGGPDSHDDICAGIAAATGLRVSAPDYRLSPEHPHPAALEDVLAVIAALPGPLVLAGDSAGACLAAAAAHRLRDPRLLGQVLVYPMLGRDSGKGSYLAHADAPMLSRADVAFYAAIRHGGRMPAPGDATALPLEDDDFTRLPMTLALAAECDPLADDAGDYATKLRAAGGLARAQTGSGLVHGWLRARHNVPAAESGFQEIIAAIRAFASGIWPWPEDHPDPPAPRG